ncbi:MAG: sodium-dependent transporter [Candidatus Marinimicrobia bacterium]|jgi:NSS family neurotransmitter:Na+ symporter|nr:sodium-dependent transporter [Candidatus Neomarinimicrobiota bacterium]MDP6610820.1 sodium-dependent transporter [Candidatus Neomarinimicrobiota bacterium]|tara:strand:+ start:6773 stop:8272 length:1500 start_codon:yes stop_codon:yes gene_type:complete
MSDSTPRFSSRFAFLISALGIAIGTGNIWRFPRIAASNGGDDGAGGFLIAWIIFLFIWSIPLIIVEYVMGRTSRKGTIGAFTHFMGKPFAFLGGFIGFVAAAIAFYYSVVVGWNIFYFGSMTFSDLPNTTDASMILWNQFQQSSFPILFHAIAMSVGGFAIYKGVSSIEKVNKILIPTLLGIVFLSVIRAITLPGAMSGISYLFTPDWAQLKDPRVWLEALTQNAWDTGAGWGLFLTYAIYIRKRYGLIKNAFTTAIGNNLVSLLAAIMVFSTVFSILGNEMGMAKGEILEVMKTSGPAATGLTFIWMPQLFAKMAFGKPLAILFFLGLTFAGFSSLISMLELAVRNLIDMGVKRATAVGWIVGVCFLMGIPSAKNLDILSNQDFVWGVALMLAGVFVAFAAIKYGLSRIVTEISTERADDWPFPTWWQPVINYVVPVIGIVIFSWWMWISATVYAPDNWYNPTSNYSVANCVVQWGIVIGVFLGLNRWMNQRLNNSYN